MPNPRKPPAPANLGPKARHIWTKTLEVYELRIDELRILEDACREVDLVERLEKELRKAPLTVEGSMGQPVSNPLVQEIRQHRSVIQRLLVSLKLPEGDGGAAGDAGGTAPTSMTRSAAARKAAEARWRRGA